MTAHSSPSATSFIEGLATFGRHHFSLDEAEHALSGGPTATRAALRRLKQKGLLAEPARGFFAIVPPEYRRLGCLPAEQFVPQLMDHWQEPYYVTLLSAAELHGAAHQRPQVFQVMLRHNRRPVACGRTAVEFIARHDLESTPVVERNTPRGTLRVATREATAFELVGYPAHSGGLDNVATVLSELGEGIDPAGLVAEARRSPIAWVQRLGYLFERAGWEELARLLRPFVDQAKDEIALVRARPRTGAPRDRRWKLAVNARVEADL